MFDLAHVQIARKQSLHPWRIETNAIKNKSITRWERLQKGGVNNPNPERTEYALLVAAMLLPDQPNVIVNC